MKRSVLPIALALCAFLLLCAVAVLASAGCTSLSATPTSVGLGSGAGLTTLPGETSVGGAPATAGTSASGGAGVWSQLSPSGGPPPAAVGQAMAFDGVIGKALLFGGYYGGSMIQETWTYDPVANTWSQLSPHYDVPPVRQNCAMVYDPATAQVLLFGGFDGTADLNDTWCFEPKFEVWMSLHPTGALPPARDEAAMAYDEVGQKAYLFGGRSGTTLLNDLWAYDPTANTWAKVSAAGAAPPARAAHSMVYDAKNGVVLVFGGETEGGADVGDLWAYDPARNSWTQVSPHGAPPSAREGAGMVYDVRDLRALIFGGSISNQTFLNDTWAYYSNTNTWTQLGPGDIAPSVRVGPLMVYDPADGRTLLFGGYDGTTGLNGLTDLWVYTPAS